MLFEAFLGLIDAGILKREVDGVMLHGAFFVGPKSFYRALREMPPEQLARIQMMPVSFTNEFFGDEAGKRRARVDARFVNNAMMATLLGAVISDGFEGGQVVSGVGGQYNFVAQAFALQGARSILTLESTQPSRSRRRSPTSAGAMAITPFRVICATSSSPSTALPICGANPMPMSIAAMLAVADSRYQAELMRQAKDAGKLAKDLRNPRRPSREFAGAHRPRAEAGARRRPVAVIPVRQRFHRGRAAADPGAAIAAGGSARADAPSRAVVAGFDAPAGCR